MLPRDLIAVVTFFMEVCHWNKRVKTGSMAEYPSLDAFLENEEGRPSCGNKTPNALSEVRAILFIL